MAVAARSSVDASLPVPSYAALGVVVGLLVFDGWSLGIIQSVIFSCAIGMAVDFVAHISHMFGR